MIIDGNHIIAEEGKVFRRIESGEIFGEEIYLGYSYYIGGVLKDPPHQDVPSDFEEIIAPVEDSEEISDTEALNIIMGRPYEESRGIDV